jgi:hypothetical protein|tara:strand:+ start:332 stop:976 length:645 start_codon:yes stop_codon:yes gene_type:complete
MAIIYSYPTLTPQFGDQVLGSNIIDASGNPVTGNPTVQYTFTSIKTLVDQDYVQQLYSFNNTNSQTPPLNTAYNIQFGAPTGAGTDNVQLLKTNAPDNAASKIQFNTIGTYHIILEYTIGQRSSTTNEPFLLFRTLQDGATQVGSTTVMKFQNNTLTQSKSLIIPITTQITKANTYYNFQMYKDTINDGSLVQQLNNAGWSGSQTATITIYKLI